MSAAFRTCKVARCNGSLQVMSWYTSAGVTSMAGVSVAAFRIRPCGSRWGAMGFWNSDILHSFIISFGFEISGEVRENNP